MRAKSSYLLAVILAGPFLGVEAAELPPDAAASAQACATAEVDAERLACYDGVFGRKKAAGPAQPRGPVGAAAAAAPATSDIQGSAAVQPSQHFGLSEQARRDRDGEQTLERLESSVTRVERTASDRQVVTLDNSQVWMQTEAYVRLRLKPGDVVEIKRAALGSFMLVAPKHGSMRVKRVK